MDAQNDAQEQYDGADADSGEHRQSLSSECSSKNAGKTSSVHAAAENSHDKEEKVDDCHSLSRREHDLLAQGQISTRSSSSTTPGAHHHHHHHSVAPTRTTMTAASGRLSQLEKDVTAKCKASNCSSSTTTGSSSITNGPVTTVVSGSQRISQFEQDILSKQQQQQQQQQGSTSNDSTCNKSSRSRPGAVAVSANGSISRLEQVILSKQQTASSNYSKSSKGGTSSSGPGAVAVSAKNNNSISQLEQDIIAKQNSPLETSTRGSILNQIMEQDIKTKQQKESTKLDVVSRQPGVTRVDGGSTSISQLERDLLSKQQQHQQVSDSNSNSQKSIAPSASSNSGTSQIMERDSVTIRQSCTPQPINNTALSQLEVDMLAKQSTQQQPRVNANQPGAVQVSASQDSNTRRIQHQLEAADIVLSKQNEASIRGSTSMNQLEQDLLVKEQTRIRRSTQQFRGSLTLTQLEQDLLEKGKGQNNNNAAMEQHATANNKLSQLEKNMIDKRAIRGQVAMVSIPGGAIGQLQDDIVAKQCTSSEIGGQHSQVGTTITSAFEAEVMAESSSGDDCRQEAIVPGGNFETANNPNQSGYLSPVIREDDDQPQQQHDNARQSCYQPSPDLNMEEPGRPYPESSIPPQPLSLPTDDEEEFAESGVSPMSEMQSVYDIEQTRSLEGAAIDDDGGIQAYVPPTVVEAAGVSVVMSWEEEERLESAKRSKYILGGAICVVLIAVAIIVPSVLSATAVEEPPEIVPSSAPTAMPSSVPSSAPTTSAFAAFARDVLEPLEINNASVFDNVNSPQYKAAEWLVLEDSISFWSQNGLIEEHPKILQRYALATLYYATDGDNWLYCGKESLSTCAGQKWLTPVDECTWWGVTCTDNGTVEMLNFIRDLEGNGLYGTLPRECSLLTELKRFLAPRNVIMGNLEDPFHALTELDTLVLTENKLNGTFPGAMLQQNPNLGVFNVGKNSIVGTLPNALVASKLSHLQLQENNFLGTIPQNIGGATRLQILDLQGNNLVGTIPVSLYNLPNLGILSLNNNTKLGGSIDTHVGKLTSLSRFEAGHTSLEGSIPPQLFSLTRLTHIVFSKTSMTGALPEEIHQLNSTLKILRLDDNYFSGPLPTALDVLTSLEKLFLDDNSFTGTISDVVCLERGFGLGNLDQLEADCNIQCSCNDLCP